MLKYYYIDSVSKIQCGPFLPNELENKGIKPETLMWRSGMQDWAEAGTLPELNYLFGAQAKVQETQVSEVNKKNLYEIGAQGILERENKKQSDVPPKTWMVEAVIFTFICCSPVSLVGLLFASRVETLYYTKRDYVGAQKASDRAKMWGLGGILFWPAIYVIYSLLRFGPALFF